MVHFAKFQLSFVDLYFSTSYHVVLKHVSQLQTVSMNDLMTRTWLATGVDILARLHKAQSFQVILPNKMVILGGYQAHSNFSQDHECSTKYGRRDFINEMFAEH